MENLYFFNYKKSSGLGRFLVQYFTGRINVTTCLVILAACFFNGLLFSQANPTATFNASFWNGYADKLQLGPNERAEFINSHMQQQSPSPVAIQQTIQPKQPVNNNKLVNPNNTIFAGPCINADFELGNMSGWTRSCGWHPGYNPLGCCPNPNGQQTIMTGAGTDPYGGFPVVYPGGNFSLRLGNNAVNGEADRIEQTFLVSAANANFSYKYAVVFEDPNHPANQQPFFQVEMLDTTGAAVPCTFYYVASGSGIPGFFNSPSPGVIYKPWSTVLVDLTPFIGQNITIRFSAYDCSLGGHFGYAYIDGVCQSFSSGGTATVCAGASTTFCAPAGVDSYTWNGPGLTNFVGQCGMASAPGIYTVTTTLFTGCPGPTFTYTLVNQAQPIADAGPSATVCANNSTVALSGSISAFPSTAVWSSSGTGVFTSTANLNTIYAPNVLDVAAGSVTLTLSTAGNGFCPPGMDTLVVTITPSPVVNAGTGGSTCNSNPFALNGSVTAGASTGSWSTSGNGTFSPSATALNASYTPGPADITAGSMTLTLMSTNNGNCFPGMDTVIIKIRQPAIVNAGTNQLLCSTNSTIGVSGTVSGGGSTGIWSVSGTGPVNPSNTSLISVYSITPADISLGQVIFTLSSTNNGPCPVVSDTVKMKIIMPSTVTAGANQFLCSTSGSITLNGSVIGFSNTGSWISSGAGGFNPGVGFVNTAYQLTPADISSGFVNFTLTSTNNGPCPAVSDSVRMRVRIPATVNVGGNQVLCSTASSVNLAGLMGGGGFTGVWSTQGTGAFTPTNTSLVTAYSITPADVASGFMTFTLTSTNNGPCPAAQDSVMMSIIKIATLTAGPNQFICSSNGSINLSGAIASPSNTVIWSSGGAGAFSPSGSVLTPTYALTPADIAIGAVTFTMSSTNNGPCAVVKDSVTITIKKLAVINAGLNQNVCSTAPLFNLGGTIGGGANTVSWTTTGAGAFTPSTTSLSPSYGITAADIALGSVIFTLTSTNNGPCPAVSDSAKMVITKIATITAGPNQLICSNSGLINLSGGVTSPSNTVIWSTGGLGGFSPSGTAINPAYTVSNNDVNAGAVTFTISSTNNGPCPVVTDSVMIAIKKLAVMNAGINQNVCSISPTLGLNGVIGGGATTVSWTTTGTGGFTPSTNSLVTSYGITAADISLGSVIFTLTSTNNGPCPAVMDSVKMRVTKIATVTAGPNAYVCSNAGTVNLAGVISSPSNTGVWSTNGSGIFLPNSGVANNTYSFSTFDISFGVLTLTLTSTNNGACPAVQDTVKIRVMKLASVNAGINQPVCSSQGSINLSGNVTGGGNAGAWTSSGSGTFSPNASSLTTYYVMTPQDLATGFVTFTLASQNSNPCPEVTDTVKITISTQALVVAGPSQTICSSDGSINLAGSISGGNGTMLWTSNGSGSYSPSNTSPATSYVITANDVTIGTLNFTLVSTNNGSCSKSTSNLSVLINEKAKVNAGADRKICSGQLLMAMQGSITGVTNMGTWSTNGTGTFSPNAPAGNYSVSANDVTQANVRFILTSINNGVCASVQDTMNLTIETQPVIVVKPDTAMCDKYSLVSLSYTASNNAGLMWTSTGNGLFIPSNAPSATHYSLSTSDKAVGNVTLTLGASSSGACGFTGAGMKVNVMKGPRADFSPSAYTIQIPDPIQFTNLSTSADTYSWTFGDGGNSAFTSPAHTYTDAGFYNVTLYTQNNNGCTDVVQKLLTVITDVKFATAFTPNTTSGNGGAYDVNDYSNDVFFPFAKGVVEYDMMIFNRWGELIFRSTDVKIGWDGYFNGKLCQQDTYVWKVNMGFFDGRKYNGTGSITLLR